MSLKLTVVSFQSQSVIDMNAVFISDSGGVGRSEDNALVLPDTEVSRHHAVISKENGAYYLSDTSLVGTYIDDREDPLHNATEPVCDGTRLKIGKYEVIISISDEKMTDEFPFLYGPIVFESKEVNESLLESESLISNSLMENNFPNHEDLVKTKSDENSPTFKSGLQGNKSALFDSYTAPSIITTPTINEDIIGNLSFDDFFSENNLEVNACTQSEQSGTHDSSVREAANNMLFDAFLQGAALVCTELHPNQQPEILHRIGQVFRKLIEGLVTVLRGRAEFKSLCRINMTTIKATNNNPFKFTVSTDEVLRQLIENKTDGFLTSTTAVEEAFSDLMNHQLAMQAGIQASLTDLLKTFDPEIIEKQFSQGIVLQKKTKYWDSYKEIYHGTVENAVDNFFGEEFICAYEKQMKLLKNTKAK
jgi:type VI secretion system FHA domain protein